MRILVLCAHTDDEVGCAGTIAWALEEDLEVYYFAFSDIQKSLIQEDKDPAAAAIECEKSMEELGVTEWQAEMYPVREFPKYRQEILESMVSIKKEYNPHIVFTHSSTDLHQDHDVIYKESLRAFKHSTIIGYELPQNIIAPTNNAFIRLKKWHISKKVKAISCYKSQEKAFLTPEFIWAMARIRGVQCGSKYAEAFELIRMVI